MGPGQKGDRTKGGPPRTGVGLEEIDKGNRLKGQLSLLKKALQQGSTEKMNQ